MAERFDVSKESDLEGLEVLAIYQLHLRSQKEKRCRPTIYSAQCMLVTALMKAMMMLLQDFLLCCCKVRMSTLAVQNHI